MLAKVKKLLYNKNSINFLIFFVRVVYFYEKLADI